MDFDLYWNLSLISFKKNTHEKNYDQFAAVEFDGSFCAKRNYG